MAIGTITLTCRSDAIGASCIRSQVNTGMTISNNLHTLHSNDKVLNTGLIIVVYLYLYGVLITQDIFTALLFLCHACMPCCRAELLYVTVFWLPEPTSRKEEETDNEEQEKMSRLRHSVA